MKKFDTLSSVCGEVGSAIDRAIVFLQDRQLAWGEFASYRFGDPALEEPGRLDSSPFVTTFVLHALNFVDHPAVANVRRRALAFLREEREEPGLWRYWSSRQGTAIDPDLDDTCCASFILSLHPSPDDRLGDNYDRILKNRHASGLFKTWLRAPEADNDVDGAVNANVLLYLGERAETHAARDIVARAINEDREAVASWYYPDALALYYMVARAYDHGVAGFHICRDAILHKVAARQSIGNDNALATALGLCTLASFRAPPNAVSDRSLDRLIDAQEADGSWPRCPFYSGPEPPVPHSVWFGSQEMTTALCLEALARSRFATGARRSD